MVLYLTTFTGKSCAFFQPFLLRTESGSQLMCSYSKIQLTWALCIDFIKTGFLLYTVASTQYLSSEYMLYICQVELNMFK